MEVDQNNSSATGQQSIHQMAYKGDLQQIKVKVLDNPK